MPWINPSTVDLPAPENTYKFAMDGGGREIVDNKIRETISKQGNCTILEIGVFLGHSAYRWLSIDPNVKVIGCDLYSCTGNIFRNFIRDKVKWAIDSLNANKGEELILSMDNYGHLACTIRNLDKFITNGASSFSENRFIPFKGDFLSSVEELKAAFNYDIVFVDAGKLDVYESILDLTLKNFNNAIICGDDWLWKDPKTSAFVVRDTILKFIPPNLISTNKTTWMIIN